MQFRAWRRWSIALLAAWVVVPTMTVETQAATRSKSRTTIQSTAKATKARRRVRRRAPRRPPPGGVYARSAIVLDPSTGEVLFEKNAVRAYPIASLTKLMTALVFLEQHPDLLAAVEVTRTELTGGGHTQLRNGERVMLGDLLHMSLMCSDNVATRVLVRESGLPHVDFLARMNRKAVELGLAESRFVEVTGLDEGNVSSATDIARLLRASADNPTIRKITTTQRYDFRTEYRDAPRAHTIGNTNRLLYNRRLEIVGGKTGFISEAGYCFATWIRTEGRDMIAVVLGAPTAATRFADVVRLVQRTVSQSLAPSAKS
jgi:D-alanyl-D-alanine endopeptidase (penicillin-binding protein 7)